VKEPNLTAARDKRAFTLAELVMALSLTAVIALAAATLAGALSSAHGQTDAMSGAIQSGRTAMMSLDASLRKAKLVAAADGSRLVLWTGDANGDERINVNELVLLTSQPASHTVERWEVVFPASMAPALLEALNVQRDLADVDAVDDVTALLEQAVYQDYLIKTILATDVVDFQVVADQTAPLSRLLLLRLRVGPTGQQIALTNSVRLRADVVDRVAMIEGVPVLDLGD